MLTTVLVHYIIALSRIFQYVSLLWRARIIELVRLYDGVYWTKLFQRSTQWNMRDRFMKDVEVSYTIHHMFI